MADTIAKRGTLGFAKMIAAACPPDATRGGTADGIGPDRDCLQRHSAARVALDVTAQNIANASTEGYVRRSVGGPGFGRQFAQHDQRYSQLAWSSPASTATPMPPPRPRCAAPVPTPTAPTLVTGLTSIDNAVENSRLQRDHQIQFGTFGPTANPTDSSAINRAFGRQHAVANLQRGLHLAECRGERPADGGERRVSNVNDLASLAQINLRITTDTDPANNSASLFDQRDTILQKLAAMAILPPASTATKHRFR
jgi:flagellar hook-associated protein 1 FlgK